MDFLKKLLFANKFSKSIEPEADPANENVVDLSEEDIDNFLSQSPDSIHNLVSTESIYSIASLFNHLDELQQVQKVPKSMEAKTGDFSLKQDLTIETRPNIVDPSDLDKNNRNFNLEAILKKIPKETMVYPLRVINEISEELTIPDSDIVLLEKAKTAGESLSNGEISCFKEIEDKLIEATKEADWSGKNTTGVSNESKYTVITDDDNTPPLHCEQPIFINLGFDEDNISPNLTSDMNVKSNEISSELVPVELEKAQNFYSTNAINMTESKDGIEEPSDCIKDVGHSEQELNLASVGITKDDEPVGNSCDDFSYSFANAIFEGLEPKVNADAVKENLEKQETFFTTFTLLSSNTISNYETCNSTKFNAYTILETEATESNQNIEPINLFTRNENFNATAEGGIIINAAKETLKCGDTNEYETEIISISSTNDECESMDTSEIQEPVSLGCIEKEYYAENNVDTAEPISHENREQDYSISQEENENVSMETGMMPGADNSIKCGTVNDNFNEMISICSTGDDCKAMDISEIKEQDTMSCTEIEYCTEKINDSNDPGTVSKRGENTHSNFEIEDKSYDSDGYHSSDFEFISEAEAERDGLIINYNIAKSDKLKSKPTQTSKTSTIKTIEVTREFIPTRCRKNSNANEPGPSYTPNYPQNVPNRANHTIPQGEAYFRLFQGMNMNLIRYMENKSVYRAVPSSMHVEYDALGQNVPLMMRRGQQVAVDKIYTEEAKQTARKIREMYPGVNRKRHRR